MFLFIYLLKVQHIKIMKRRRFDVNPNNGKPSLTFVNRTSRV